MHPAGKARRRLKALKGRGQGDHGALPHTPKSVFWLLLVNQKRLEKGLVGLINPVFQSLAGELASLGNVNAKDIFKTVKDGKKRFLIHGKPPLKAGELQSKFPDLW